MRGNGYLGASGKNLTVPFAPATSISYNRAITLLSAYILPVIWRIRRNSVNSASGLKTAVTIVFSDHDFL